MQAPRFWYPSSDQRSVRASILAPFGFLYAKATALRVARPAKFNPDIPVICVGNINIGGTGKTPTVIWLSEALKSGGHNPVIVTRGYGGSEVGPVVVDPNAHTAMQVGDEPLLLAAFATTIVSKDRATGAKLAVANNADIILLDDGFQNPDVAKSLSIVVADAKRGFGNGHVIPAGPLREPVATGLKRADFLLSIGEAQDQAKFEGICPNGPSHLSGRLVPLATGMPWSGLRVLAFAGIGHPQKFFDTLTRLGADVVEQQALEDHQPLSEQLMSRLQSQAKALSAQLVTTEKDAVRLPLHYRSEVLALPVRLHIDNPQPLLKAFGAQGLTLRPPTKLGA